MCVSVWTRRASFVLSVTNAAKQSFAPVMNSIGTWVPYNKVASSLHVLTSSIFPAGFHTASVHLLPPGNIFVFCSFLKMFCSKQLYLCSDPNQTLHHSFCICKQQIRLLNLSITVACRTCTNPRVLSCFFSVGIHTTSTLITALQRQQQYVSKPLLNTSLVLVNLISFSFHAHFIKNVRTNSFHSSPPFNSHIYERHSCADTHPHTPPQLPLGSPHYLHE